MRNVSSDRYAAQRARERVMKKMTKKENTDRVDWVLAFMQHGFTKAEAKEEFRRLGATETSEGFVLLPKTSAGLPWKSLGPTLPPTPLPGIFRTSEQILKEMDEREVRLKAMAKAARALRHGG